MQDYGFKLAVAGSVLDWPGAEMNSFVLAADYVVKNAATGVFPAFQAGYARGSSSKTPHKGTDDDLTNFVGDNGPLYDLVAFSTHDFKAGMEEKWFSIGLRELLKFGKVSLSPCIGWRDSGYGVENLNMEFMSLDLIGDAWFWGAYSYGAKSNNVDISYRGPFVALVIDGGIDAGNRVRARLEYGKPDYDLEADWTLREDVRHPVSFRQTGRAGRAMLSLDYERRVLYGVWLLFGADWERYAVRNGKIEWYLSDGTEEEYKEVESERRGVGLRFGTRVVF